MKNQTFYIVAAVQKLRPEAEFTFSDDDYSTIKFDKLVGKPPTSDEIEAAIESIKKEEIEAEKKLAANKAAAEAKLAALGLTADDLKALGLA